MAASVEESNLEILKFVPFSSCINPSFWYELNRIKLEDYKLNDDFKSLTGFFNTCSTNDLPPIMNFDYASFQNSEEQVGQRDPKSKVNRTTSVRGQLKVFNTVNEFNLVDKNKLLDQLGQEIWLDIKSDRAVQNPNLLQRFCLITFANLKSYVFQYWFAFPAISFPNKSFHMHKCLRLDERFDEPQVERLLEGLNRFEEANADVHIYFALDADKLTFMSVEEGIRCYNSNNNNSNMRIVFGFFDPNSQSTYPGWPLRNYLALLALKCKKLDNERNTLEILSLRDRFSNGRRSISASLLYVVEKIDIDAPDVRISTIGWERNEKSQLHPRVVDMSNTMNTEKLAESAVNLNLKLMKWRIAPLVDLDTIKNQKCLLLGSGTLGCNVARTLMAWGVSTITFVDNSKVSYSNPVRQSLFIFQDCISRDSNDNYKSVKAAEHLKQIYPGVNTKGVVLSIPMPGHQVADSLRSKVRDDVAMLTQLISDHDCVFLLMDTRESRWLPTVIAASMKKLVINSALGFDSFLVMRHGVKADVPEAPPKSVSSNANSAIPCELLGCYFCNDIVAPGNSTLDRTLDQQCTVSRPGLSMIASALAVELMVTLLQHPLKHRAPSSTYNDVDNVRAESCLGIAPHQIRGYLHSYSNVLPASQAFDKCTACSNHIISMYERDGFDFLIKVFNESAYLEEITGLKALKTDLENTGCDLVIELSDDE